VCGAAGAPPGECVGLHGHGLRRRVQLGVCEPGDLPERLVLQVLRYQCQRCRAVVMVAPRGVLPSHRYTAVSIALSLALWSVQRLAGASIRERVSPLPSSGYDKLHGWRSLGRWARRGSVRNFVDRSAVSNARRKPLCRRQRTKYPKNRSWPSLEGPRLARTSCWMSC
jgi:hypothetical protein